MTTMETNQKGITLRNIWQRTLPWQQFIRFGVFSGTAVLPLLGVATVSPLLTVSQFIGLLLVALSFHIFAYVLNDVVDLPVDRLNKAREADPLVMGTVKPRDALIFALAQLPVALLLTAFLEGGGLSYFILLVAFAMLAIYDIWGKLNPYPPVTDFLQGVGWAALIVYGASILSNTPPALTWFIAGGMVLYVMILNGVYGALRDVPTDLKGGRITASILLGARPDGDGRLFIPTRLKIYMYVLQFLILFLLLYPLISSMTDYATMTKWGIGTVILLIHALMIWASYHMVEQTGRFTIRGVGYTYWLITLICFFLLLWPAMTWSLRLGILVVGSLSFPLNPLTYHFFAWCKEQLYKPS